MSGKSTNRKKISLNSKRVVREQGYSTDGEKVIWRFDMIDRGGKFAFDLDRADFPCCEIMKKMIDYCNMTWAEVKKRYQTAYRQPSLQTEPAACYKAEAVSHVG